ncbi:MAG: ribosome recycling factor [Alphaproteobacteria bacterium]|nr:MAG: ribosome recycling factor [Alphaproteobacteria bacterium]
MEVCNNILDEFSKKVKSSIDVLYSRMDGLRTDILSPDLLNNVEIDQSGHKIMIKAIATVTVNQSNRTLKVAPWDKSNLSSIKKAILSADLNLNPIEQNGGLIVPIPPLTEETRAKLVKTLHKFSNDTKISVRNIRQDCMTTLKKSEKSKEISEDERKRCEKDLQNKLKAFENDISDIVSKKEKQIMSKD